MAALARSGSNVLAVGGWLKTEWLLQLAGTLDGIDAYCVGVYCPLEECERREAARGDRWIGYARSHYDAVHLHEPYDLVVDTAKQTTEEAAAAIKIALADRPPVRFFARIRASAATLAAGKEGDDVEGSP
jgi:chloramphenicol 3-O phosphotransferase